MCTYLTEKVSISGSGKGPSGWFRLTDASVYFDHPVHAQAEHTLNIDFLDPAPARQRGSRSSSPRNRPGPWPRPSRPRWTPRRPAWSAERQFGRRFIRASKILRQHWSSSQPKLTVKHGRSAAGSAAGSAASEAGRSHQQASADLSSPGGYAHRRCFRAHTAPSPRNQCNSCLQDHIRNMCLSSPRSVKPERRGVPGKCLSHRVESN